MGMVCLLHGFCCHNHCGKRTQASDEKKWDTNAPSTSESSVDLCLSRTNLYAFLPPTTGKGRVKGPLVSSCMGGETFVVLDTIGPGVHNVVLSIWYVLWNALKPGLRNKISCCIAQAKTCNKAPCPLS